MPDAAGFDYFDAEADVGIEAWGPTLEEAFAQAALGALALAIAPDGVEEQEVREVRAQGDAPEALLVAWVNECLYVHEIEGFAVRRVVVDTLAPPIVHGVLHGEAIDLGRHRAGTPVGTAAPHEARVEAGPTGARVRLVVDARPAGRPAPG